MVDRPAKYGGDPIQSSTLGYGGQSIDERDRRSVAEALDGDYITRGPTVQEFEECIAKVAGVDHAIATTSGTTALHLAGQAAGWGEGDEVITTPLTFASTAHAATYTGADPVFTDIEQESRGLDPEAVQKQVNEDTVGILPMHYGGHPADIEGLLDVADDYDLTIVWDACHAFGGTWRGESIGSQRDMAVFSFHPVKNITTGEGGAVVTDDDKIAERLRDLRSFDMNYEPAGHEDKPWFQVVDGVGYNYNITDMQAALGLSQLERLSEFKSRRDQIISTYNSNFTDISGIQTPPLTEEADPFYHLYAVEIEDEFGCGRKEFVNAMHAENIGVQVHYVPLHYHPYFQKEYGYKRGDFPVAESVYDGLVSLPLFPEMSDEDVTDVVTAVKRLHMYNTE